LQIFVPFPNILCLFWVYDYTVENIYEFMLMFFLIEAICYRFVIDVLWW